MTTRLFLTVWIVYAVHFSTNVVREHYPAFALIKHGTFCVDEYEGFHPDIFVHRDGHAYIGNNVASSVVAAMPLLVFNPALDALEAYEKQKQGGRVSGEYRSEYPLSREFFRRVAEQGLVLRFGAATFVTSVFLTAPLSALCVVLLFGRLKDRGVSAGLALWLALLFAFATPVFFRSAHLSNNLFVMYATFGSFLLLWPRRDAVAPAGPWRRAAAGALAGFALACDYSGLVCAACLFFYLILARKGQSSWPVALRESVPFMVGSLPPVLFLLYSQWAMYGDPFLPGQYWMPAVNYTDRGWRGFSLPRLDVFLHNLLHPSYGMLAFAPLLALGLIPAPRPGGGPTVLPGPERWFVAGFTALFLVFCAANQYSLMQWNCGFRYLLPVVPFVFLAASDWLLRLSRPWQVALTVLGVGHMWVLCLARDCNPDFDSWRDAETVWAWLQGLGAETIPNSYRRLLDEGLQLPALRVVTRTLGTSNPVLASPVIPYAVVAACGLLIVAVWTVGRKLGATQPGSGGGAGVPVEQRANPSAV